MNEFLGVLGFFEDHSSLKLCLKQSIITTFWKRNIDCRVLSSGDYGLQMELHCPI